MGDFSGLTHTVRDWRSCQDVVVPERLPRLFELFCVFQLLRSLEVGSLTLLPIDPGVANIAQLENERYSVGIYHDRGGNLSFHIPLPEVEEISSEYLERYRRAQEQHKDFLKAFLGSDSQQSLFSGRPDLVIEIYDKQDSEAPVEIVLGDIKYSDHEQTFARGLEELTKYMEFVQKEDFISTPAVDISGLVITDGVETKVSSPLEGRVTHLTAGDLQTNRSDTWIPHRLRKMR